MMLKLLCNKQYFVIRYRVVNIICYSYQWNQPLEEAFKATVATAATKYCSKAGNCKSTPAR